MRVKNKFLDFKDFKYFLIFVLMVLNINTALAAGKTARSYLIYLRHNGNSIELVDYSVGPAQYTKSQRGNFTATLYSLDGKRLFTSKFDFENKTKLLVIPYFKNGGKIVIRGNNIVREIDISIYSSACGDGICESNEDYLSCSSDCESGVDDGVCDGIDDGRCDPNCFKNEDPDCARKNFLTAIMLLSIVLISIFILLLIKHLRRGDKNE